MPRKKQNISITKIAEEAGVSVATISRVMNRRTGVSEEVRSKIDQLLRKYYFKPNYPAARAVRIAVLMPRYNFDSYTREVIRGIYTYTEQHGLSVSIIVRGNNTRESILEEIRDLQCSGVIVVVNYLVEDEYVDLTRSELPVVFLDTTIDIEGVGFIDNDSYSGACEAANYLLSLGHRRIGFLQHTEPSLNQAQRFNGYKDTLNLAGIEIQDRWVVWESLEKSLLSHGEASLAAMTQLLEQAPEITAVMTVDDNVAMGALTAIHQHGLRIPEDISIIGFDNYPETRSCFPPLTTVDHPIEQAAAMAIDAINCALINPSAWIPPREKLATKLLIRASTGPAPHFDINKQMNTGE